MQLKQYQEDTLNVLQKFFETSRICGHLEAYRKITSEPEIAYRLGKYANYTVWKTIPNTPRVCLRVPTGGGKTIIAAHSIKIASETWLEKDVPVVLWFCPTETIRKQTSEALKNPRHPYREALDDQFKGKVKVFDIDEKFNIRPSDIEQNLCIVVSVINSFRQGDTSKYNVYKHNENLESHFTHITATENMEKNSDGSIKFSFANLLNHHKPIIIVDEAHNALTGLSEEMQGRINPSAIMEFTATPKLNNNTLYRVTAKELKEEEMIKLPIELVEHNNWECAITEAIAKRAELEKASEQEKEYIRPILLFQAQNVSGEVNVETLKRHLIEQQGIEENQIAIATGEQKELDGINVFDRNCPIRYIITVEALKEGWDCSFAYILCSLSNVKSDTAVEQLLGRVMRMPYAKSRKISALNKAYAYVLSQKFGESTECIVNKLKDKGFSDEEAVEVVEKKPADFGLFGIREPNKVKLSSEISIKKEEIPTSIELEKEKDGSTVIKITERTTREDIDKIKKVLDDNTNFELETKFANFRAIQETPSPAKNGVNFKAPYLMADIQGELELVDAETVFEYFDWNLEDYAPYQLTPYEFKITKQGSGFVIDLDNTTLKYSQAGEDQLAMSFVDTENWTEARLIKWLDAQLRNIYFSQGVMMSWLEKVVNYLINDRGLKLVELMIAKYVLANKLKQKIEEAYDKAKRQAFQLSFLEPTARVEVDFNNRFEFFDNMYDGEPLYQGTYNFDKHYLGKNKVPSFDGGQSGEEFACAKAIDTNSNIKFWLRNVARNKNSFWLPTSSDKFYPDFVAELNDGRILIIEYKGAHLADNADTREKALIGKLWEEKMQGKGLFMIALKTKDGLNVAEQIEAKIG